MASQPTPLDENTGQDYLNEVVSPDANILEGLGSFGKSTLATAPRGRSPASQSRSLASKTKADIKEDNGSATSNVVSRPSSGQDYSFTTPQSLILKDFDVNKEFQNIDNSITAMQLTKQSNIADLIARKQALLKGVQVQTDLRPLAMLVDAWTGSKFASQYMKPDDAEKAMAQVAQIDQKAQDDKQQIAGLELEKAKMKIQLAIQAEKAKSDNLVKSINALSQMRGLGVKEEGQANQLEIARLKLENQQNKVKPLPQGEVEKLTAGKVAYDQMEQLKNYVKTNHDPLPIRKLEEDIKFKRIPEKEGLAKIKELENKQILGKPWFRIAMKLPNDRLMAFMSWYSPETAFIDSAIRSIQQNYAKSKEGGVLREYDEKFKYEKMLANFGEQPDLFFRKWKLMQDEVARNYDTRYNYYSKAKTQFDMSDFRPLREGNESPEGKYEFGPEKAYPPLPPREGAPVNPPPLKAGEKLLKMNPEQQKEAIKKFRNGRK